MTVNTRIQIDLQPKGVERLSRLKEKTEATSNVEVIRAALRIYENLLDMQSTGHSIGVHSPDGFTSLSLT